MSAHPPTYEFDGAFSESEIADLVARAREQEGRPIRVRVVRFGKLDPIRGGWNVLKVLRESEA